jgi:hypothetical protein
VPLAAAELVAPGGLFCLRVNAIGTDLYPAHDIVETGSDDGTTIRYLAGPKLGLDIHFFGRGELESLIPKGFEPLVPLTKVSERRKPPDPGAWCQWEAIWIRR